MSTDDLDIMRGTSCHAADECDFDETCPLFAVCCRAEAEAMRDAVRADVLAAFNLKPWHVGLAPAPPLTRWQRCTRPLLRAWLKITRRW